MVGHDAERAEVAGGYGPPGGGYGGPPPGPPPGGGGYGPPGGPPPGGSPPGFGGPPGGYGPPGGFGPPGFGGPPQGFGPPGFGPPPFGPAGPKVHPLAITSLVLGILSIPLCCCSFFGIWAPIGAIVCGVLAMNKIKESPHLFTGNGLCIAGIVTGGLGLSLDALAIFSSIDDSLKGRVGHF